MAARISLETGAMSLAPLRRTSPSPRAPSCYPPKKIHSPIMKWRLAQVASNNRWYPVMGKYVSYIAGRVNGMGGNASAVAPSP